jgi:hypothetical protein
MLELHKETDSSHVYLAGNVAGQPVQTLVQTLTSCGTSALDVPARTKLKSYL